MEDTKIEEVKNEPEEVVYGSVEDMEADLGDKTPPELPPENKEEEVVEPTEEVEVEPEAEPEVVEPPIDEPKPVEGETPRERGLRRDNEILRERLRKEQTDELFKKVDSDSPLPDDVLKEYDPEEVGKLEKLIGKLGYVKKGELDSQNYETQANDQLKTFLETHTEYLPENDKDGLLWKQFKNEYQTLNANPKNPKDYKKIFDVIHTGLSGSQATDIKKINASKEKIKVASHSGASMTGRQTSRREIPQGIRTDGLKGFDEAEIADLLS